MKVLQAPRRVSLLVGAAAATTQRQITFDTLGAHNCAVLVGVGALATTNVVNPTVTLEESDVTGSGFATWSSDFSTVTVNNATAVVPAYSVPLQGRKRYLRLTLTPGTHTANGPITSFAVAEFDDQIRS
jgi:predicted dinucleotide-utilizing enzyme